MAHTTTDLSAEPGDHFDALPLRSGGKTQSVILRTGSDGFDWPLRLHADLPTLLALADSLVASAWALKTAAEVAATQHESRTTGNFITADEAIAAFTPADPEVAAEG